MEGALAGTRAREQGQSGAWERARGRNWPQTSYMQWGARFGKGASPEDVLANFGRTWAQIMLLHNPHNPEVDGSTAIPWNATKSV